MSVWRGGDALRASLLCVWKGKEKKLPATEIGGDARRTEGRREADRPQTRFKPILPRNRVS